MPSRFAPHALSGQLLLLCVSSLVPPLFFVAFYGGPRPLVSFFPDDAL